jgi:Ca2+/H+ antiporter
LHDSAQASRTALFFSNANVLLVCVPLGIAANAYDWSDVSTFILNFFAIFALASVLSYATDELSDVVGQTIGGLLNATFGNMVELLVRISSPIKTSDCLGVANCVLQIGRFERSTQRRNQCGTIKYGW